MKVDTTGEHPGEWHKLDPESHIMWLSNVGVKVWKQNNRSVREEKNVYIISISANIVL